MSLDDSYILYRNNNIKQYMDIYPWLTERQLIEYFSVKNDNNIYKLKGLLISHKSEYYYLTPIIEHYQQDIIYTDSYIKNNCVLVNRSFEYQLSLFKLVNSQINSDYLKNISIKLNKIQKSIPKELSLLFINNKEYDFEKILKPIINRPQMSNIYYKVHDIPSGSIVYSENKIIGLAVNKNEIINIYSMIYFISESISNNYKGLHSLYYKFKTISSKELLDKYDIELKIDPTIIEDTYGMVYNKLFNLQTNDILLKINGYNIESNNIEHNVFGKISIFTYVMLNYKKNETIDLEIIRNKRYLTLKINPLGLYDVEIIPTNINTITNFINIDGNIYYELNINIVKNMLKHGGISAIDNDLKSILMFININPHEEKDTRMVFKFTLDDMVYKKIKIENYIENQHIKNISNI